MIDTYEKILDSNFINADLIGPVGAERVVEIKDITKEECNDPNNMNKKKIVSTLHFTEGLPMVINSTNGKKLMKLFGSDPKDTVGKKIVLKVEWIKSFGGTTAIRIHEYNPVKCECCGNQVLPTKKMTIQQVVDYGKKNCHKVMCMPCIVAEAKKQADKKKEEQNE